MIGGYASETKGENCEQGAWLDIPGFENLYQASTDGRIRTKPGKTTSNARYPIRVWKTRVLKVKRDSRRGDQRVTLWKDGKSEVYLVARLVAITWVPGFADGMTVNHINGNNQDNRCRNLEWVSLRENIKKGFATGLYDGISNRTILIDPEGNEKVFRSMSAASKSIGRNVGYISLALVRGNRVIGKDGITYKVRCG